MSGFDKRVQVNKIVESQLPEFITADFPKAVEFFKQYYISQEYQGGNIDIAENLDQYLKLDKLTPEVLVGVTSITSDITTSTDVISVNSTKGFPKEWGLLKIDDEIITYTGITTNTFTGCVRGFSGVTGYNAGIATSFSNINRENLIFSSSTAATHTANTTATNLSVLFLKEFYKKLKTVLTPGLENSKFTDDLDVSNFIKSARAFYQAKGIAESIRILFTVLYGKSANVLDLEERLIKPSSADYIRREIVVAEPLSGDPTKLVGQTIFKSTDSNTTASVSEVEILTRQNKVYYQLSLFVGYNERDLIEGVFTVPGKSKVLEPVSVGSSIVSVDSTVGFGTTGTVISGNNTINYTSKTINQFFGCSGITVGIGTADDIRSNEVIYGYEKGDSTKRVNLRITGVLSGFTPISDIALSSEKEIITVRNIGERIDNPIQDKTYKEIFANSWIYNTCSRYQIDSINGTAFTLLSTPDKSSLKKGDVIDIKERNQQNSVATNVIVTDVVGNQVFVSNLTWLTGHPTSNNYYDLRRQVQKADSTGVDLKFGNDQIMTDVLNVYTNKTHGYVASNSLPSYTVDTKIWKSVLPTGAAGDQSGGTELIEYNNFTKKYYVISFPYDGADPETFVKFKDGDIVVYTASGTPIGGLTSGDEYYISKENDTNRIRLYSSLGQLHIKANSIGLEPAGGTHTFTLKRHSGQELSARNILRKFPLSQNITSTKEKSVTADNVGVLVNGVEISSPKSTEIIYYGPIDKFDILNGGRGYDVVNPPEITIASPGAPGTQAKVEPFVEGSVQQVFVDPQDFDIEKVNGINLTGGNGLGCTLEAIMGERFREMEFDSRDIFFGGGLDINDETITFKKEHKLVNGEGIIYNQNGNEGLGIGVFGVGAGEVGIASLSSGDKYYIRVVNPRTIKLYNTASDALHEDPVRGNVGINTVGFSTATNASGIHKFRTVSKNTLRAVKVINSGSGYKYRKIRVQPTGISTVFDTITSKDHGFKDGDNVVYISEGTRWSTATLPNNTDTYTYKVITVDKDKFRLAQAGAAGTDFTAYNKNDYVNIVNVGVGTHIFKYPDIKVNVNVSYGQTSSIVQGVAVGPGIGSFTFTPIVTGAITGGQIFEGGVGYGVTNIPNLHKKPLVTIKNGKNAELKPILVDGRIKDIQILSTGSEYYSTPTIRVTGSGTGCILRPVITDGKVTDAIVVNTGIGYSTSNTNIIVDPAGTGAIVEARIRPLQLNDAVKFGDYVLRNEKDDLAYSVYGYSSELGEQKAGFEPLDGSHSEIIGWAYDGNPIYGPYGYEEPENNQSRVRLLKSGYALNPSGVIDRPSGFADGSLIEDYQFNTSGDLDEHNGRYCKTPDFPNGVYAYFAGVSTAGMPILNNKQTFKSAYPYFVGNTYKSPFIQENFVLDQNFDFNNSDLSRNTFPYKVNDKFADNDFILESNEYLKQESVIESVNKGDVDSIKILDGGRNYNIGDVVNFDDSGTSGTGLKAVVSELVGIGVSRIDTEIQSWENSVFVWENEREVSVYKQPYVDIRDEDTVIVSGLSTSVTYLQDQFKVGVSTSVVSLAQSMSNSPSTSGIVTDLYLNEIPNTVSVGGSFKIGNEIMRILNIYPLGSVLRARRFGVGVAHTYGSEVSFLNDKLTLNVKTPKFDSRLNKKIYFNGHQAVGVGTTAGAGISTSYKIGESYKNVFIPTRTIYVPDHPFKTGDKLTISKKDSANAITVGIHSDQSAANSTYQLPNNNTDTDTVYAIVKSKDHIGISTGVVNNVFVGVGNTSEGLYFYNQGDDDTAYLLETNYEQVTGRVDRVVTTVTTTVAAGSTEVHGLKNRDRIKLSVEPKLTVGIGTTAACSVHFDEEDQKILLNPISITFSAISTTDTFTYIDHRFNTGDKIWYKTISGNTPVGLRTKTGYFVHRITDDTFKLAHTWDDARLGTNIVSFTTAPTSVNSFSLINPPIKVIRNSNLQFGLTTSTLSGFNLKLFYDKEFTNEFNSVGTGVTFNVVGVGTVGEDDGSLTVNYSKDIPTKLYYTLEKGGYISTADTDVKNFSEIEYVDSEYNGEYKVFNVGVTTFQISPISRPGVSTYFAEDCDTIEYSTKAEKAQGSVKAVRLLSKGFSYKKLPKFVSIASTTGRDANLVAISTSIGRIKEVRIKDIGYEYPSDKTLRPQAYVAPVIRIDNLDTIESIDIIDGGKNYVNPPDLVLFNPNTKTTVDSTSLVPYVPNSTIAGVDVLAPITGLESVSHEVIALNNSNGVGISTIYGGGEGGFAGVVTCILDTPVLGFSSAPFAVGDEIFVEGIELYDGDSPLFGGSGYNSDDYDYNFYTVSAFSMNNPAELEFRLAGFTTNPGVAKTFQSGYATITNKRLYPKFRVNQTRGSFDLSEQLYVDTGTGFFEQDLYVSESREDFVKVTGTYELFAGYTVRGKNSGVVASITSVINNEAKFEVDYSSRQDYGWIDNIGKLSEDFQVTPDNDYFQNLSYSIQSPITWDKFVDPVNRVVHPLGLKNFADTAITTNVNVGVSYGATTKDIVVLDVYGEKRVDTINTYDEVLDYDIRNERSKYLQLQTTKLTDYNKCLTNRVLIHDDISEKFSSKGTQDLFTEIEEITDDYARYLIQVVDPDTLDSQINDIIVSTTTNDAILFEKSDAYTNNRLGEYIADADSFQRKSLRFNPVEKYVKDHDIKILKTVFNTDLEVTGSTTVGSITLTGTNVGVGSTSVGFTTTTIAEFNPSSAAGFNGLFANVQVQDTITRELNFLDVLVDFDGSSVSVADYYFDNTSQTSTSRIGIITATYDSTAGIVSLTCENDRVTPLDVRANIVGFGTTTVGLSTYRFAVPGQPVGAERSARLESIYNAGITTAEIYRGNLSLDTSLKSLVRVSCGHTSALHQVHLIQDTENAYVTQMPFIANGIGATTGLGTFGANLSGGNAILNFYPDPAFTSRVEVQSFNEVLYTVNDFKNEPPALTYGSVTQSVLLSSYDGINGNRANKTDFDLLHETVPIYTKTFNPSDATQLDPVTGIFTIRNHFFNTGEKLTYEPKSTFIGVGQTGVGIGQTESYLGVQTSILPPVVYPVVINADQFKIVTRKEYASTAGTHVTFTDFGEGNAHEFEMTKKLTKTVIGLDGIVQQPITYTTVNHALEGAIPAVNLETGVGKTFSVTGIATVQPRDVIKVGDEFMKVIEVGFSTQRTGPIRVIAGAASTFSVVSVERGALGTASTSHLHNSRVDVYRGSFNIVGSKVHFLDPPKGNTRTRRSETNLPYVKAEFSGRTFLRSNYDNNMLFDDISDDFTGIGKTYTVTVGGENTTGLSIGNGILFINGVFQTPITENNGGNNYSLEDDTVSGISSVIFTGITSTDGSFIKSDFDINQNQLPRGGLIVSLGSTAGLGYAPLVGAKVLPKTNATGEITSIVGVGTTGNAIGISTAYYDNESGIIEITTDGNHNIHNGDMVKLEGMNFTCQYGSKTYPFAGVTGFLDKQLDVVGVLSTTTLNIKVGTSTVTHIYQGQVSAGTTAPYIIPYHDLTFGSGYRGPVSIGVTDLVYEHKFVRSDTDSITIVGGATGPFTPTNVSYASSTGVLLLTIPNHGTTGQLRILNDTLTFTCARDNHSTEHTYPRATDPASGQNLPITVVDADTLSVNVGSGGAGGTGANITAQSAANDHTFVAGSSTLTNCVDITGGGTLTPTSATYDPLTGEFVITKSSHGITGATAITPTAATYAKTTGMLTLTSSAHGFSVGDWVLVADNSLTFTCSKDNNTTQHHYPRETDPISGKWVQIGSKTTNTFKIDVGKALNAVDQYDHTFVSAANNCVLKSNAKVTLTEGAFAFTCAQDNHATTHTYPRTSDPAYKTELPVGSVTANTFNVIVGKSPAGTGGVLKFNIVSGGTGYINPSIEVPQPVYENMPVRGVSRLSIGNTTDTGNNLLLNLKIDQSPLQLVGDRFGDAARLIKDNAQLIGEVAVGRMLDEYPSFQVASGAAGYNNQDCIDDIKDVLDSVNWNLQYGGNDRTVDTANLYVTDDHVTGEEQESIYAFKQAARLAVDVMRNKSITLGAQHTHRFVSATSSAIDPSTGSAFQPTGATYDPATGDLVVTKSSHGLTPPAAHTAATGTAYNPSTGVLTVVTTAAHGFSNGDRILIKDESLTFTCARDSHATQHSYPRATDPYSKKWLIVTVTNATTFTVNVGVSQDTSAHTFVYADPNGILKQTSTVTIPDSAFQFTCSLDDYQSARAYPRSTDPASSVPLGVSTTTSTTFTVNVGASQTTYVTTNGLSQKYDGAITVDGSSYTPTSAAYESSTGILTLTLNNHGFVTGERIKLTDNSLTFTCDMDGNATEHSYPRNGNGASDPASNSYLSIGSTTNNTFEVNVGPAPTKKYTPSAVNYNPTTGIMDMTIGAHCFERSTTLNPTWAEYNPTTGYVTVTVANHGLCSGNRVRVADNAFTFACNFGGVTGTDAQKSYPRSTDPISGKWIPVQNVTTNTFQIQVLDITPSTNVRPHTFVSVVANSITKQGNLVRIAPHSLNFTCAQDSNQTVHSYPRVGDPVYNESVEVIDVSAVSISVQVLPSQPSTNVTAHTFVGADTDSVSLGHYDHTFVRASTNAIQKQSVAACANVASAIHTLVGIVTTGIGHTVLPPRNPSDASLFGVQYFEKARDGHSFDVGDKFEPVGLVTAQGLRRPRTPFQLEVVETFNDYFTSWQFGQIDFIDPIKFMLNGSRRRFPLRYNGELLSFEVDRSDSVSSQIDLNSVLLIFVNGVLQIPGVAYQFEGGATFTFTEAPDASDQVDVFFYVGQSGVDSQKVTVLETLKQGDEVRVYKHPLHNLTKDQYRERVIMDIAGSDILETDTYVGQGITETTYKPIEWSKQKTDMVIKGDVVSKGRDNIKAAIYPTAHIIQDVSPTSTSIFVDNSQFFHYEFNEYNISKVDIGALIIPNNEPVSAAFTAVVSAAGTISSFDITNVGAGYSVASIPVTVGIPTHIGVGIGTTATGTATITNGSVSSVQVTNPGLGYTRSNPPQVLSLIPTINPELIKEISNVQGFSGIITGIGTTTNSGQLALNFFYRSDSSDANDLTNTFNQENVSVVISGTRVGTGVTSVDTGGDASVVGISTICLDNVYRVHNISNVGPLGLITCNVHNSTDVSWANPPAEVGIATVALNMSGINTTGLGKLSWGRIYNYTRGTNPISIGVTGLTYGQPNPVATEDPIGLSTYPTIQRRLFGARNSGGIRNLSA